MVFVIRGFEKAIFNHKTNDWDLPGFVSICTNNKDRAVLLINKNMQSKDLWTIDDIKEESEVDFDSLDSCVECIQNYNIVEDIENKDFYISNKRGVQHVKWTGKKTNNDGSYTYHIVELLSDNGKIYDEYEETTIFESNKNGCLDKDLYFSYDEAYKHAIRLNEDELRRSTRELKSHIAMLREASGTFKKEDIGGIFIHDKQDLITFEQNKLKQYCVDPDISLDLRWFYFTCSPFRPEDPFFPKLKTFHKEKFLDSNGNSKMDQWLKDHYYEMQTIKVDELIDHIYFSLSFVPDNEYQINFDENDMIELQEELIRKWVKSFTNYSF